MYTFDVESGARIETLRPIDDDPDLYQGSRYARFGDALAFRNGTQKLVVGASEEDIGGSNDGKLMLILCPPSASAQLVITLGRSGALPWVLILGQ